MARPTQPLLILGGVNVNAASLSPIAGNDFVPAVPVEIRNADGVSVKEGIVDHLPRPAPLRLRVDDDLISVPRFDGTKKAPAAEMADGDVA